MDNVYFIFNGQVFEIVKQIDHNEVHNFFLEGLPMNIYAKYFSNKAGSV